MSALPAIITEVLGQFEAASTTGEVDVLELTSEERASAHFTAYTLGGRRLRLSLPRGMELQDGDILHRDEALTIIVRAAAEELLLLCPGHDAVEWHAACYQLGNLHRPARFLPDGVLTPRDPMVVQFLSTLDVKVTPVVRPFIGRRFGAAGAHHHHGDAHAAEHNGHGAAAHDHGHGHDHGHAHGHSHTHTHAHAHEHSHAHDHDHDHDHPHDHDHAHAHGAHHHGHAHG